MNNNQNRKEFNKIIREKYCKEGIKNFSESEMLQLLLSYTSVADCKQVADYLIKEFSCIKTLLETDVHYIVKEDFIDLNSATLLKSIIGLNKMYKKSKIKSKCFTNMLNAREYFESFYCDITEEIICVVCVKKNMDILENVIISKGSFESVNVNVRKIIDSAIKFNAYGIFISHNHPMSTAQASSLDLDTTNSILKIMHLYDIKVFDHMISGKNSFYSMKDAECGILFDNI